MPSLGRPSIEALVEILKVCANCEYFDRFHGDCLNPRSPRFQTEAQSTCNAFFPSTTDQ